MSSELHRRLQNLDGKSYGAYKSLKGRHQLDPYMPADSLPRSCEAGANRGRSSHDGFGVTFFVDKVQSDPYAPPSLCRVRIPLAQLPFAPTELEGYPGGTAPLSPERSCSTTTFSVAELDVLNRRLAAAFRRFHALEIDQPGQQVLQRAAVAVVPAGPQRAQVLGSELQICFEVQLPARGRRILGREAARLICDDLTDALYDAFFYQPATIANELWQAASLERDQSFLRRRIGENNLVAFIADGSILPRAAGNSDEPMPNAIPFKAPESLAVEWKLPSGSKVRGMGIPRGVTLIVGGGYHGKSTLLSALVTGVYDHIGGDGRELVAADDSAVALRAEDGRAITKVDISPFINGLPSGGDTSVFSTANASGSTSQSAALMEALEARSRLLLIDEDTSATNFMIRDERMRALVPKDREPITPLVDRVRELWEEHGISTVVVAGGSGAFIDVADTVIAMDAYEPHDVTEKARELACGGVQQSPEPLGAPLDVPALRVMEPMKPTRDRKGRLPKPPRARGKELIQHGREDIDLRAVRQIVESSQTRAIARIIAKVEREANGRTPMVEAVRALVNSVAECGFDELSAGQSMSGLHPGQLATPRVHEVMAALNRYRKLRVVDSGR